MRNKILNKRFAWVFIACFLTLVGIGGLCLCEHPYHTNPNLRLLVGDTTTKYDDINCSNPVVSPDENTIYYLGIVSDTIGGIYSINADGSNNKKILDGNFDALSISHDGKKLAVHSNAGSYPNSIPESLIIVIHLDAIVLPNIDSLWVTPKWISKIEWNSSDEYLFYMGYSQIYRLTLVPQDEEIFAAASGIAGFDLYNNDSLYLDSTMEYLQINSVQEEYAIGVRYYDEDLEFLLRNTVTNKLETLPDSLMPYSDGTVGYPYWFANGEDIVFTAKPYTEPAGQGSGEIWVLENVFEQIEE